MSLIDSFTATTWLSQIRTEVDELTKYIITLLGQYGTIHVSLIVKICRANAARVKDIAFLGTILRACRQDLTITNAALSEVRAELAPTRGLLERLRNFLQTEEVKIPENFETDYCVLMEGDPCDIKPASSATASNVGELDAQQTTMTKTKEDQHGKVACSTDTTDSPPAVPKPVAHAEKCSVITHVSSPEPCMKSVAEGRMNDSDRDTKVSLPSTSKSSAAGEAYMTTDKAAGNKCKSSDRVDDVVKKVKIEQGPTEPECPNLDRTLPRVKSEGEGESSIDFVRVKHEK